MVRSIFPVQPVTEKQRSTPKLPDFYLNPPNKAGRCLIMYRIYDSQLTYRRFVYSTKEKIEPKYWDANEGCAKKSHEYINTRLEEIQTEAWKYIRANRGTLTKANLKAHLDNLRPKEVIEEKVKTFLEEWHIYLEVIQGNVTKDTFSSYLRSYKSFADFLKSKKQPKLLPLQFDKITFGLYRSWLKQKYPAENTVAKRIKHLKMAVNFGIQIRMNPDEITFSEKAGLKISLTDAQLKKAQALNLSGSLDRIRDLMVVQCYTGVRVSDLFRLDRNIVNGRFEIQQQQKTKKPVCIPILPPVKAILEKYNYRLPFMSDQKYNDGLKLVYKAIDDKSITQVRVGESYKNIHTWRKFSSHDCVRTFITISADKGMPIPSIAQITGKTVNVLLKNYLNSTQSTAEKEMLEKWT